LGFLHDGYLARDTLYFAKLLFKFNYLVVIINTSPDFFYLSILIYPYPSKIGVCKENLRYLGKLCFMHFQSDFFQYTQWTGIATLAFIVLTILGFLLKWGIRFRLVGTTGFMLVITAGLFALSLAPLTRIAVPGALRYTLVYDNGASQTVITIPQNFDTTQLDATLRQASSDLYSFGRSGVTRDKQMTIRARTIIHPEPGVSVPLYVGQVKRSLNSRENSELAIEIYDDKLAQLPKLKA
jgi:hypothetical protein